MGLLKNERLSSNYLSGSVVSVVESYILCTPTIASEESDRAQENWQLNQCIHSLTYSVIRHLLCTYCVTVTGVVGMSKSSGCLLKIHISVFCSSLKFIFH